MNQQTFSLQTFPTEEYLPDITITGNISRDHNRLTINYQLAGDLKQVVISSPADTPNRKDELWQETCFEFFLGIKNSQHYWEFNLSPTGDWNIYHFDDYRQGMQAETAFTKLPFRVQNQFDSFLLSVDIDLTQIIPPEQVLEVGITTVVKQTDNHITYWALTHKGTAADFHLRNSFVIML
ncbi:MAG TPA: DOMON-like domain-containing protein [Trichormus sp. M33_DOE_039]|nr:DOMON-like domain-containing protein [Trichormus sp. M33_DOE_039]